MENASGGGARARSRRAGVGPGREDHIVQGGIRGLVGCEDLFLQGLRDEHSEDAAGNPILLRVARLTTLPAVQAVRCAHV